MFDIGFSEILLVAIAALIAIGPKDLPDVLFRMGRFSRQVKMFVGGVRNQYSEIMHEAEVTHYRKELGAIIAEEKGPVTVESKKNDDSGI